MHHDAPHLKRIWNSFTQHIALLKIHFEVVRNNSFYVATVLMLSCNNSNPRSFCPSCASMRWFSASVKAFATSRNRWYIKTLASISMNLTSGSHFGFKKMHFTSTSLLKTFVFETEVKRKESQYLSRYAARMPQKTSHQVRHSSPLPLEPVADEMPLRILMDIKFAAHNLLASLMHHYHLQMSMSKTSLRKM